MLQRLYESTVSALCYEIAAAHAAGAGDALAGPYNDVVRFVLQQRAGMPRVLGSGVQFATLVFAAMALPHGGLFHRLPPPRRGLRVAAWALSGLGPCRDLMRFYSSLAIVALYSRPAAHAAGHLG